MIYLLRSKQMSITFYLPTLTVSAVAIYRLSGIVWVALCLWTLKTCTSELRRILEEDAEVSAKYSMVLKWASFYSHASECVSRTNSCFGMILLCDISCIFIRVIVTTFTALQNSDRLVILQSLNTFVLLMQLLIIITVAEHLRAEVG